MQEVTLTGLIDADIQILLAVDDVNTLTRLYASNIYLRDLLNNMNVLRLLVRKFWTKPAVSFLDFLIKFWGVRDSLRKAVSIGDNDFIQNMMQEAVRNGIDANSIQKLIIQLYINKAIERSNQEELNNIIQQALTLGFSQTEIYNYIRKYHIINATKLGNEDDKLYYMADALRNGISGKDTNESMGIGYIESGNFNSLYNIAGGMSISNLFDLLVKAIIFGQNHQNIILELLEDILKSYQLNPTEKLKLEQILYYMPNLPIKNNMIELALTYGIDPNNANIVAEIEAKGDPNQLISIHDLRMNSLYNNFTF